MHPVCNKLKVNKVRGRISWFDSTMEIGVGPLPMLPRVLRPSYNRVANDDHRLVQDFLEFRVVDYFVSV
jgi:hypothetical protein